MLKYQANLFYFISMDTFEQVVKSVVVTYLKDNRHSAVASSENSLESIFNQPLQIVELILELPNGQKITGNFHFSAWSINATISADHIDSKIVKDFTEMIEYLKTNFALVYKTIKC